MTAIILTWTSSNANQFTLFWKGEGISEVNFIIAL